MNVFRKISHWYFTKEALPYWCVLILDCVIVLFSGLVGAYFEIGGDTLVQKFWPIVFGMLVSMPIFIISFYLFHTYQGFIRYSSYADIFRLSKAVLLATVVIFVLGLFVHSDDIVFPGFDSAFILFGLSVFIMSVVRLCVQASFESFNIEKAIPVAIYGTQAGGVAIAHSIRSVKVKKFFIRCFISDKPNMEGTYLLGRRVFYNSEDIVTKLVAKGVKTLLVSPLKSELFRNNQAMVNAVTNAGIRIMMLPTAEEWDGKSEFTIHRLHEVEIEDLLPREKIQVDLEGIRAMLAGKCVLITGAAGSIGSEMVRQVAKFKPSNLVLVDQAETPMHDIRLMMARQFADVKNETVVASITDKVHMEKLFSEYRPEYVFHAAAYKHVPMMEDNPAQAVRNNINGTRVIADLAVKYGTKKFVMVSTDKAVNPTNVMGCSKRICEIYCQSLNAKLWEETQQTGKPTTQFITTRFGNVLGSNGSVIPLFKNQIKKGGPITVTHPDIIRFFMLIPEACQLVLEAGTMGKGGEIFVFDMGKPVRIVDLAKQMIQLSGANNIEIQFTGLRDGEKLYEEVLSDKENTKPTHHPKIMVAHVREYDYEEARRNEDELLQISYSHDDMAIVKKMKEIVPEYKSQVSKYEVLDKAPSDSPKGGENE